MKRIITKVSTISIFITICSFYSTAALAQSGLEILEHSWRGISVIPVEFTRSGEVILTHKMKIKHTGRNKFSGSVTSMFDFDGVIYKCDLEMTGTYNDKDHTFTYKTGEMSNVDKLPYDLQWCGSWGTLTIYTDADRDGYYLLRGDTKDTCGGNAELEFSDYHGG